MSESGCCHTWMESQDWTTEAEHDTVSLVLGFQDLMSATIHHTIEQSIEVNSKKTTTPVAVLLLVKFELA